MRTQYGDITEFRAFGPSGSEVVDSGSASTESQKQKEIVIMDFAYKADLIFEVMVTQRRESRLVPFDQKVATEPGAPCLRCCGTGMFITGTVNGKPAGPGGPCYRCAGKGFQTEADRRRNYGYDNFGQRVSLAS